MADDDFMDPDLALAIQLSKEEAAQSTKKGKPDNSNKITTQDIEVNKLHSIKFNPSLYGEHLLPGFKQLYDSKLYADITLVVGSDKLLAHKLVLCSWSETFRVMLENDTWKESHQQELPIFVEEREVPLFKKMIAYMYIGSIEISFDEVIPLLALANYYAVLPLKDACGDILAKNVDEDNVFFLLEIVNKYSCAKLNTECGAFLAEHFGEMLQKDKLMSLDVDTWVEMLKSDEVQVHSEESIFEAVLRYANQFPKEKKLEVLGKTLPQIRFPILSNDFIIDKVENNAEIKDVPVLHDLLHLTYRYKAYPHAPIGTLQVKPRKGTMMFDKEHCHSSITLSSDRLSATNGGVSNTWTNVRCFPAFTDLSYREFSVRFSNYMMVGLESKESTVSSNTYSQYPGQTVHGWSWYSIGQTYHNNACVQANAPFASGDTVGILVNVAEGKCWFYKNGKPTKASFTGIPTGKEYFPVISFYSSGDSAQLLTTTAIPKQLPAEWTGEEKEPEKSKTRRRKKGF